MGKAFAGYVLKQLLEYFLLLDASIFYYSCQLHTDLESTLKNKKYCLKSSKNTSPTNKSVIISRKVCFAFLFFFFFFKRNQLSRDLKGNNNRAAIAHCMVYLGISKVPKHLVHRDLTGHIVLALPSVSHY